MAGKSGRKRVCDDDVETGTSSCRYGPAARVARRAVARRHGAGCAVHGAWCRVRGGCRVYVVRCALQSARRVLHGA
eukprot:4816056-Lingulodinium_polyedra.AAC.1